MQSDERPGHLAFIGFGEAAQAFISGWAEGRPDRITAYDLKTEDPETRPEMTACYGSFLVIGGAAVSDALTGAPVIFSVVTADQALAAAEAAAPHVEQGALWLDCNSCAPETKRRAAEVLEAAGARYVDVAVMAPVHPKKHLVPLLVSGPHAEAGISVLDALGMKPTLAGADIGAASSIKMLRSVMVKGLEALTAECFLAARRAGVEEQVIASLEASDPDIAWRRRGAYNIERMMVHGARRAAEMQEVAKTVSALDLPNAMSAATVQWQEALSQGGAEPGDDDLTGRLDRALSAL
ncbi:DUF1932 domain-containing protein [Rhodobacterales bacterium HKCCE4037]|nr:DUF1932 domain-containing protein [Rhodobacterales bacterium HKCCE4037]